MDRTIYAKYSNERAAQFCIRTDIVTDESGKRKVYKYALTKAAEPHIRHIGEAYQALAAAYEGSGISFCPAETQISSESGWQTVLADAVNGKLEKCRSASLFLTGTALQDVLERMLDDGDTNGIRHILQNYIRKVKESGGSRPFAVSKEFIKVFGDCVPDGAYDSAEVSDIDMIFSNIFVEKEADALDGAWTVIDYEWTFDFAVPKAFIIYRAIYFAWHQVFYKADMSLAELFELAEITQEEAADFRRMEEHFQEYMGQSHIPVRNMQRLMGTRIVPINRLLGQSGGMQNTIRQKTTVGRGTERMRVRKLLYHMDRKEYQDGSMVCSGWALAKTWDGRALPVEIRVTDKNGNVIPAEIGRRRRQDVAETLKLRNRAETEFGFDCVWFSQPWEAFRIRFSLGNRESIYEG